MRLILLGLLVFFASACTLEPASTIGEIELTVVVNTPEPTLPVFTPAPSASPTITLTPSPTALGVTLNSNCTARTDLPVYTVVVGDSLSAIAARTNSTVTQLVEWNCLANANMIVVGMRLQIAQEALPPTLTTFTSTPTPLPTVSQSAPIVFAPMGVLAADPAIQNAPNWTEYLVIPQTPLTIIWSGIDLEYYAHVGQIEFFYTPDGSSSFSVGIDPDKSDGMAITWMSPANVAGRITAHAVYGTNGKIESPAIYIRPQ